MIGLLNVHKPRGITSRDAVNRIQALVRPVKVGHAGTLDPLATGVLVVAVGGATRLIEYVQAQPKRYVAQFRMGCRSDTDDVEGSIQEVPGVVPPTRAVVERELASFVGQISQLPPAYSAVKVGGQRAYDRARRGESVVLTPRVVHIEQLVLHRYEYPWLELEIVCGSGTYVRSIGRDLGERLATGAIMTELVRTAIGSFRLEAAQSLDSMTRDHLTACLLPPLCALGDGPRVVLGSEELRRIGHGQAVLRTGHGLSGSIAGLAEDGRLIAVLQPLDADRLRPVVVLATSTS
ncbi:MAG: tRNA pseudouridine(55) synthase TruB [Pirellulaceae bacterium]